MIMTEKTKDFLHAITITIAAIICIAMAIPGTIYVAIINTAMPFLTFIWGLITVLGAALFSWGAYTCWKEYRLHHKNK